MADRDKAKNIAQYRKMKEREAQLAKSSRVSLEGLAEQIKQAGVKELHSSSRAMCRVRWRSSPIRCRKCRPRRFASRCIHSGVGAITESDILLASASNAIVIGFNVRPDRKSAELAEQESVEIRLHSIIYELQDEIRKAMLGLLDPVYQGKLPGARRSAQRLQDSEGGHHRRLPRNRWSAQARRRDPVDA